MKKSYLNLLILFTSLLFFSACEEDELNASVSINETADTFGGDVTGEGGSLNQSFTWNNSLRTADYNMDITSVRGGSFNLTILDANGDQVLNQTLIEGQGDDSRSGVTTAGQAGEWTVTVTLVDFNGDGSFSLSPGN